MAIGQKEWIAKHNEYAIRVVNTWFSGVKLYVDSECRDTISALFSLNKDSPVLSARLNDEDTVEIFFIAWMTTKAKICVNGEQIGGDVF